MSYYVLSFFYLIRGFSSMTIMRITATKCNKNTLFGKYQTSGYYKIRLKPCLGKTVTQKRGFKNPAISILKVYWAWKPSKGIVDEQNTTRNLAYPFSLGHNEFKFLLKEYSYFISYNCIFMIFFLSSSPTLLLKLPSESEGENLVRFIQCHCPLNIKLNYLQQAIFHWNRG